MVTATASQCSTCRITVRSSVRVRVQAAAMQIRPKIGTSVSQYFSAQLTLASVTPAPIRASSIMIAARMAATLAGTGRVVFGLRHARR